MIIFDKKIEYTVEWYYPENLEIDNLEQYVIPDNDYFIKKMKNKTYIMDEVSFFDEIEDNYGLYNLFEDFDYIKYSAFYSFFINNSIDVPRFFKKTKSVKRSYFSNDYIRFVNYLMRSGKKSKSIKIVNLSIFSIENSFFLKKENSFIWKNNYILISKAFFKKKNNINTFNFNSTYENEYLSKFTKNTTEFEMNHYNRSILMRNINELLPIFSFYVYKVDKKIFKNTRGKSGKYTFIWKYVTTYKRRSLVMFWLMRELRISEGRSLINRLTNLINNFVFSFKKTWIYKVRKFSHNYVYRNCKNTLAENYVTVKK